MQVLTGEIVPFRKLDLPDHLDAGGEMTLGFVVIGSFMILMLIGVPVTIAIGAGRVAGLYWAGLMHFALVFPQQIIEGTSKGDARKKSFCCRYFYP